MGGARISGGGGHSKQTHATRDEGFGKMGPVVVLRHMLDDMDDLQQEVEDGLGQEIGEECGEKVRLDDWFCPLLFVLAND